MIYTSLLLPANYLHSISIDYGCNAISQSIDAVESSYAEQFRSFDSLTAVFLPFTTKY